MDHEQRKALTAAAANYGSPLLYIEGDYGTEAGNVPETADFQDRLQFTAGDLAGRYDALRPQAAVSLITIGCPQASVGEIRAAAGLLKDKKVAAGPDNDLGLPPLWIFTSSANKGIAERTGLAEIIIGSGALLLENTCPEVVPYDQAWVKHILTNSMKAEHYLKSGLNGIPASVMRLADCIAAATGERVFEAESEVKAVGSDSAAAGPPAKQSRPEAGQERAEKVSEGGPGFQSAGKGLPSLGDFLVQGEAFVTVTPITLLGFVNRETGVIEEPGHPADGQSMAGKVAIFPKGTGSTVAPYVLLELYYRGAAPLAILNTEIDQQSAPACSLEGIPYAYGFDGAVIGEIRNGAQVEVKRQGDVVTIRMI
jgi:predicted aconitase with swiveling domain